MRQVRTYGASTLTWKMRSNPSSLHAVIRAAQTGVVDDGVVSAHPRRSFSDGSRLGERREVTYHDTGGLRDGSARLIRTLVVARMKHSAVPTVDEVERSAIRSRRLNPSRVLSPPAVLLPLACNRESTAAMLGQE